MATGAAVAVAELPPVFAEVVGVAVGVGVGVDTAVLVTLVLYTALLSPNPNVMAEPVTAPVAFNV